MKDKNKIDRPDLIFEQMDATQTTYPDDSFSVVLDKGTLDALMPDTNEDTILRINKYFGVGIMTLYKENLVSVNNAYTQKNKIYSAVPNDN